MKISLQNAIIATRRPRLISSRNQHTGQLTVYPRWSPWKACLLASALLGAVGWVVLHG